MLVVAGWVNHQQLKVIEYLQEENRLLKDRLRGRRIRFSDIERRRLARRAYALGYWALNKLETIVTPETLMRWYRKLIAQKWTFSRRRGPGRPRVMQIIEGLVIRMATENPSWGYTRILGALANLGHKVGRGTVAAILKENGIDPANRRKSSRQWSTFLKAHWESLVATDFFSVEVCTLQGFVTHYVLFFLEISTRRVHIAGITPSPNEAWMLQVARNITDPVDGCLSAGKYLIMDRDSKYCASFQRILENDGIQLVQLPPRSPNLNAFAERFVRSIKDECLSRMIFVGKRQLRYAINEYLAHYHAERNHQGVNNNLLAQPACASRISGPISRRQRLGGLLSFYHRSGA